MTWLRVFLSRLAGLFVRAESERRLAEEIEAHLEMLTDAYVERGLSRDEARTKARRSFGGVEQIKELYRDQRGLPWADALWQDLGFGLRVLVKERWVNAVLILTLGLGIGANTATFSLVDRVLLASLPVESPERLVHVDFRPESGKSFWATYPAWERIRDLDLFDGTLAWFSEPFPLSGIDGIEAAEHIWVSRGFFDVLGVSAALGRTFGDDEDAVAVISDAFWKRRFGAEASVLGRALDVKGVPFTIIGIMPSDFFGPDVGRRFDVALPVTSLPLLPGRGSSLRNPPLIRLRVMARLRPQQTPEDGTRALRQAQPGLREATLPDTWRAEARDSYLSNPLTAVPASNGVSSLRSRYRTPLLLLMAVTGLVLVIACGNLASLLLARASGRSRELGIRSAMGASRLRLGRQLFTEALLLSLLAGLVGLLAGHAASRLVVRQMSTVLERVYVDIALDLRLLGFSAAAAFVTAVVVGLLPAFSASRASALESLNDGWRARSPRFSSASVLVVIQVAVSLVLVVGAGLFLRTFVELQSVELGFEPRGLLLADLDLSKASRARSEHGQLADALCQAARSLDGVAFAACSPAVPIGFRAGSAVIASATELPESERRAHKNWISEDWLETFETRLLAGRAFTDADREEAPLVALVNEAFVERFGKGGTMVGETVREDRHTEGIVALTVVGVVEDTVYRSVREPAPPTLYVPLAQAERSSPWPWLNITLRVSRDDPSRLAAPLRLALAKVAPELPVTLRLFDEQVAATYNQERVLAFVATFFSGLALALAALGLFGVTAHTVSRRRKEIGIRMALGANPRSVLALVLARVGVLVGTGIVAGASSSLWVARVVESLLFESAPRDASLLLAASFVLLVAATVATYFPVRRACRLDPSGILRED